MPAFRPLPPRRVVRHGRGTPLPVPLVTAVAATGITAATAGLVGSINPQGLSGSWWFVYGTTPQFGSVTTTQAVSATSIPQTVGATLTGLATGVTYWFALVGQTAGGTVTSAPVEFVPANPQVPVVASNPATATTDPLVTIPHFAYPFQFTEDGMAVVEQDSLEEVFACVQMVAACPIGACPELPTFGIPDIAFSQAPVDAQSLADAIQQWEPRAAESAVSQLVDDSGLTQIVLTTQYAGSGQ